MTILFLSPFMMLGDMIHQGVRKKTMSFAVGNCTPYTLLLTGERSLWVASLQY
jgi:hypothetical protein